MAVREYAGAAKRTAITGDITAASTTITVTDATGYPTGATGPFAIALELGAAAEEKVLITSRSGNTLTVSSRGYDGTTAASHSSGATVDHVLTAIDIREANAFINGGAAALFVGKAGGDTITASGAAVIPLVVKGAASQTANLAEFQNSAGTVLSHVTAGGTLNVSSAATAAWGTAAQLGGDSGSPSTLHVVNASASIRGLTVKGAASQSANLAEFQNSAGTVLASVNQNGTIRAATSLFVESSTSLINAFGSSGIAVGVEASAAAQRGLLIRGAASQTANLAEFQNSSGTVLFGVTAAGRPLVTNYATTANGGAYTLPTTCIGFFEVQYGGVTRRVPMFDV